MTLKLLPFTLLMFAGPHSASAAPLDWLIGCWESKDNTAKEVWVKEQDGSLSGFSVSLKDNDMAFYEVLRITIASDGTASYAAHPVGQSSTIFKANNIAGSTVTFTNLSHDYPQEISYRREGDKLLATISAMHGKNPRTFNKQVCD